MRRVLVLVALVVAGAADAQRGGGRFDRVNSRCAQGRSDRGLPCEDFAFFEFAPSNGAGMGAACACTTPTGAKGEVMTFTRTGNATCSRKGLATTGIANGDLVICTSNQPRVEPSGGVLGLRVEGSRTNEVLRSEEFDNAAWTDAASGVAAPTTTANAATAPNLTLTAERFQVPATTAGQYSYRYQGGFSSVQRTTSVYIRGNGTSGTINLLSGASPNACTSCAYVADSWSRCELPSAGTASTFFFIGNDSASAVCTTSSKAAQDVFVWGFQHETGTYATSYIPTVSAAVTRNAENARFATVGGPGVETGSIAASVQFTTGTGSAAYVVVASNGDPPSSIGNNQMTLYTTTAGANFRCFVGNSVTTLVFSGTAAFVPPFSGLHRGWCSASGVGSTVSGQFDTNSMSPSGAISGTFAAENNLAIGSIGTLATTHVDGIVTRVCRDPDPSRCR